MSLLLLQLALASDRPSAQPSDEGQGLLVGYGAAAGALQASSLQYVFQEDVGAGPLILGGAGGALLAWQLSDDREVSVDQAMLIGGTGLLGAWTGYEAGLAIIAPGAEREDTRIAAAGQLGNLAGTGLGLLVQNVDLPATTTTDMLLAGAAGWQLGAGIGDLAGWEAPADRQKRAGLQLGTGYALMGADLGVHLAGAAPPGPSTLLQLGSEGAWIGGWAPLLGADDPFVEDVRGGVRVGAATGYVAAVALSQRGVVPGRDLYSGTWFALGSLLAGGGASAACPPDVAKACWVGPMLGGGVAGHVLGELTWSRVELEGVEGLGVLGLGGWTAFQAAAWESWARNESDLRPGAASALAAGGHGALAVGLPAFGELAFGDSAMVLSLGGWGAWIGGWATQLPPEDQRPAPEPAMLIAGDGALLAGAAATQLGWSPSLRDVALVDALAFTGATAGTLVGQAAVGSAQSQRVGNVVGTSAGLAAGLGLALALPQPERSELAFGLPRPTWARLPVRLSFVASPWTDDEGGTGAWVQLSGTER